MDPPHVRLLAALLEAVVGLLVDVSHLGDAEAVELGRVCLPLGADVAVHHPAGELLLHEAVDVREREGSLVEFLVREEHGRVGLIGGVWCVVLGDKFLALLRAGFGRDDCLEILGCGDLRAAWGDLLATLSLRLTLGGWDLHEET
ncbi:hypothetical protein ACFPRL_28685 [Pseudoclavibacter helvolus]